MRPQCKEKVIDVTGVWVLLGDGEGSRYRVKGRFYEDGSRYSGWGG